MSKQDQNHKTLSEDELDAVAGGVKIAETEGYKAMWKGLTSTCGEAGQVVLAGSLIKALGLI